MRHNARAIIIRNKKLLLVTGHDENYYWTPGGGVENDESVLDALHRELQEELGIKATSAMYYMSYSFEEKNKKSDIFMVETLDDIVLGGEITRMMWYSKEDFINDDIQISLGLTTEVIPRLIEDGLL